MSEGNFLSQFYGESASLTADQPADGLDPTKYHDPHQVLTSRGISVANVLPSVGGFRTSGVIVPRHRGEGGSLGFDPHKLGKVFIDPEMTGNRLMVDYGNLSREQIERATSEAAAESSDPSDRGVLTYIKMAEMSKSASVPSPFPSGSSTRPVASAADDLPSPPGVALPTRSTVPGQPAPGGRVQSIRERVMNTQAPAKASRRLRVDFELPGPAGTITAFYHDVLRTGELLVLVYDYTQAGGAPTWSPTVPKNPDDTYEIGLLVYDEEGRPDTGFVATPTPAKFPHRDCEYILLVVVKERSYKETDHGPG